MDPTDSAGRCAGIQGRAHAHIVLKADGLAAQGKAMLICNLKGRRGEGKGKASRP